MFVSGGLNRTVAVAYSADNEWGYMALLAGGA
jgi:hypothetical protein